MAEQWSEQVVAALEALGQLRAVWFAASVGFGIPQAEGQPARLYRENGEWVLELQRWKKTAALRDLFEGSDVFVMTVQDRKVVHAYDARIDQFREIGANPSASYSEEQRGLIARELTEPPTGDSEKVRRLKGMIDALPRQDLANLRSWILARFDDDGSERPR